jgi:hypothetical protein
MIWISVSRPIDPGFPQRYAFLERRSDEQRLVRFEAVGDEEDEEDRVADVQFDSGCLVVDYPGIASRSGKGLSDRVRDLHGAIAISGHGSGWLTIPGRATCALLRGRSLLARESQEARPTWQ